MFDTPDFGHSDLWHFNFAIRFFMSEALKGNYLPLWSKDIAGGFPLFAESQIGLFNFYNFLAFKLLNPVLAFDLGYLVIFLTTLIGTYLFCRSISLQKGSSFFAAISFSLCGIFVTHVPHYNYIQTASFLPWIFFLTEKLIKSQKWYFFLFLGIVVSQQLYTGYPQISLISVSGAGLYAVFRSFQQKSFKGLIYWAIGVFIGTLLAAPQLVLTWQLLKNSPPLLSTTYSYFPFPPIHLLSFLNPYIFGDPRIGTYPSPAVDWGIFWESTGYFGLIAFLLSIAALAKKNKSHYEKIFIVLALLSLILLLGKYTPFFFIDSLPPFSAFRLPARYILLFTWSLVIIAANFLDKFKSRKLTLLIIVFSVLDISYFALTYNPVINGSFWLKQPDMAKFVKKDTSWYRVHAVAPFLTWNGVFLTQGWSNMQAYFPFRNSLDGNQNLYWKVSSIDFHSRLTPKRVMLERILVEEETNITSDNKFFLSPSGLKILSVFGVKYITSPREIKNATKLGLKEVHRSPGNPSFRLYKNPHPLPHAYLTRNFVEVNPNGIRKNFLIKDPRNYKTIVEKKLNLEKDTDKPESVYITKNTDLEVDINLTAKKPSLLVLSDSFYPGWEAKIDDVKTEILPANINQRAVIVPEGKHRVVFAYHPFSCLLKCSNEEQTP